MRLRALLIASTPYGLAGRPLHLCPGTQAMHAGNHIATSAAGPCSTALGGGHQNRPLDKFVPPQPSTADASRLRRTRRRRKPTLNAFHRPLPAAERPARAVRSCRHVAARVERCFVGIRIARRGRPGQFDQRDDPAPGAIELAYDQALLLDIGQQPPRPPQ